MTLWQRIKSWFGFKPKAAPTKFEGNYDFADDHYIEEVNGVFVKDGIMSAGSQRDDWPETKSVKHVAFGKDKVSEAARRAVQANPVVQRSTPVRSYGESECNHDHGARIGGVTTSSLRPDGSFIDGMFTGYMVGEALEAVGNMISGDRDQGFTETRSAPAPVWQEPAPVVDVQPTWQEPASSWNSSGTTSWGGSGTTTIDGGSNWVSDVADSVSSVFSD